MWRKYVYDENRLGKLKENLNLDEFKYLKYNKSIQNIIKGMKNELINNERFSILFWLFFFRENHYFSIFKLALFDGALNNRWKI